MDLTFNDILQSHLELQTHLSENLVSEIAVYFNGRCLNGKSKQISYNKMYLPKKFCCASFSCLPENNKMLIVRNILSF